MSRDIDNEHHLGNNYDDDDDGGDDGDDDGGDDDDDAIVVLHNVPREGLAGCQMAKYRRARCKSHVKKYRFWICINFALDWDRTDLAVFIDAGAQNIWGGILCQNIKKPTLASA